MVALGGVLSNLMSFEMDRIRRLARYMTYQMSLYPCTRERQLDPNRPTVRNPCHFSSPDTFVSWPRYFLLDLKVRIWQRSARNCEKMRMWMMTFVVSTIENMNGVRHSTTEILQQQDRSAGNNGNRLHELWFSLADGSKIFLWEDESNSESKTGRWIGLVYAQCFCLMMQLIEKIQHFVLLL